MSDKMSLKDLLFSKALPNYTIPIPTDGHKVYPCIDCGDKFILESSYNYHVNRISVNITYMCRHCSQMKIFSNRCQLLSHLRSHNFKTATINVNDLKVEPISLQQIRGEFKMKTITINSIPNAFISDTTNNNSSSVFNCFECKKDLSGAGPRHKERAIHCMEYTNEVFTCPICLFALPTKCGLKAHLRFHLKCPPFYCPECGNCISSRYVHYPYRHDCEGFKMMRATARLKCQKKECYLFHPNDYKDHMKKKHLKKVYKCPFCVVACFNELTMAKHMKTHNLSQNASVFYQCELCPGRLVLQTQVNNHMRSHVNTTVFPCWTCGVIFIEVIGLLNHHLKTHCESAEALKNVITYLINEVDKHTGVNRVYQVVKRCSQCERSFDYKCKFEDISVLPYDCPYKCSSTLKSTIVCHDPEPQITCFMCKLKIAQNWEFIKKHYAEHHKKYTCLDAKIVVHKLDTKSWMKNLKYDNAKSNTVTTKKKNRKTINKRIQRPLFRNKSLNQKTDLIRSILNKNEGQFICTKCGHKCEDKDSLETHIISHRDLCMAYQCMECGQSFVVKPSFSKHLLLEHNIVNTEDYIRNNNCYNKNALDKYKLDDVIEKPLGENQCKICRDSFDNSDELKNHFRVHGMAFLMKSMSNKINS